MRVVVVQGVQEVLSLQIYDPGKERILKPSHFLWCTNNTPSNEHTIVFVCPLSKEKTQT